jgi:hypothetical protein
MQDLRKHYRSAMTDRDYQYFDTYSHRDQALVIDEAKDRIQEENLSRLKESISSTPITKLLGMVSHVSESIVCTAARLWSGLCTDKVISSRF